MPEPEAWRLDPAPMLMPMDRWMSVEDLVKAPGGQNTLGPAQQGLRAGGFHAFAGGCVRRTGFEFDLTETHGGFAFLAARLQTLLAPLLQTFLPPLVQLPAQSDSFDRCHV